MVQRTFVSYHEIVILAIIWSDYLIKLLFTTYFNKYVIYVLAILMATTFLNPNSRNGAFLAFFLYLPTYLVWIIPGSAEVYEGRDVSLTGPFIPEYGYPLILCPIIGTALMIYMGRYMELEPSGPYGVGHSYKPVIEDDFYMNSIVFYPVKKSEYDGYKYHIRQNLKWFQPGSDGISTQAKDNGLNPILMHELLTYRIYSVENRRLQKDFLAKHKKLTPVIVSHGITHWCTSLSAYILELVSHGCIVFTVDHTDGSCIGYKDFSKDPEEFVPYASHSEQTELSQTQYHEKQLKTRMKDVEYLLKFIKEEFKEEPWDIDFDNLVALGHSFGATSAMEMCKTFPDAFKYWVAIDPWYMPNYKAIVEENYYDLKQPLLSLSTELFHSDGPTGFMSKPWVQDKFDSLKANDAVFASKTKNDKEGTNAGGSYKLILKNTAHNDWSDKCLYMEKYEKASLNSVDQSKYQVFINIVLAFLNEHNALPVDYHKQVMEIASPHI